MVPSPNESIFSHDPDTFWGLNIGLGLMVVSNLFPGGVLQLVDVLNRGYWHARSPEFLNERIMRFIEWARLPADGVFIVAGVIPVLIAVLLSYKSMRQSAADSRSSGS